MSSSGPAPPSTALPSFSSTPGDVLVGIGDLDGLIDLQVLDVAELRRRIGDAGERGVACALPAGTIAAARPPAAATPPPRRNRRRPTSTSLSHFGMDSSPYLKSRLHLSKRRAKTGSGLSHCSPGGFADGWRRLALSGVPNTAPGRRQDFANVFVGAFGGEVEPAHLFPQRGAGDAQEFGRLLHLTARPLEDGLDMLPLGGIDDSWPAMAGIRQQLARHQIGEEIGGIEPRPARQGDGPLHAIAQFPDIAGPAMRFGHASRRGLSRRERRPSELRQNMRCSAGAGGRSPPAGRAAAEQLRRSRGCGNRDLRGTGRRARAQKDRRWSRRRGARGTARAVRRRP